MGARAWILLELDDDADVDGGEVWEKKE